jgi:hypothetical protein
MGLFLQEHITNPPKRVASRSSLEKLEAHTDPNLAYMLGKHISAERSKKHANTRETSSKDNLAPMLDIPIRHISIKSFQKHDTIS